MYTVDEFRELMRSKGFSESDRSIRINPHREVYLLGMEGGNTKYITEFSAIAVIDTSHPHGYSVEYSVYKDVKTDPQRGRAIIVDRVLKLRGNFDHYGEPVHDDFFEQTLKILEIFQS